MIGTVSPWGPQSACGHRIDGDAAHGHHVGQVLEFLGVVDTAGDADNQREVGVDGPGHRAGKPDEILSSGNAGQIYAQGIESVDGIANAKILSKALILIGKAIETGAHHGHGAGERDLNAPEAQAFAVAGHQSARRQRGDGRIALAIERRSQNDGVRCESLNELQSFSQGEDGHMGSGRNLLEVVEHLCAHVGLIGGRCIDRVQQQDQQRAFGGCGCNVGVNAGRQLGEMLDGGLGSDIAALVPLKECNVLRHAIFEYLEA